MEENAIVSEISFGETSGGAAMVQGSYVGSDQSKYSNIKLDFFFFLFFSLPLAFFRREIDALNLC